MKATHAKTAEPDDCFFLACKNGTRALFRRILLMDQVPTFPYHTQRTMWRESLSDGKERKRLTAQVFSFNYLSLCILRLSARSGSSDR